VKAGENTGLSERLNIWELPSHLARIGSQTRAVSFSRLVSINHLKMTRIDGMNIASLQQRKKNAGWGDFNVHTV
jgi:hypothetical protein